MNARSHFLSRLREIDWDFTGAFSESPFSASHWHPGRFASQVPAALIGILSEEGDLVLDPFVGSGTTLVEAQRLFRRSIGIDLNPVSCLISEAKTLDRSAEEVAATVENLIDDAGGLLAQSVSRDARLEAVPMPDSVQSSKWYTPRVAQNLALLWQVVSGYQDKNSAILGRFAFSAILLSVCRETRHWGYVCDNTCPQDDHEGDVLEAYTRVLRETVEAYRLRDSELRATGRVGSVAPSQVICGEVTECLQALGPGSVDLIITSPPYFGVCDYTKAQRLSLEWMEVEIEVLRLCEIGARSKRHRRRAQDEYLGEMSKILALLQACLKPEGKCVLILGESSARPGVLANFCHTFSSAGFHLLLDLNRTVSSQRRQTPSIKGEHLLVLEKVGPR